MKRVSIIGRPNVGKSRFFNRVTKNKISIVLAEPGITRDRISAPVEWLTRHFELIDTGGISDAKLSFQENINEQAKIAIDRADLVLFMVSYLDGLTPEDLYVASVLKRLKPKKVMVLVNKAENFQDYDSVSQFLKLGFGQPYMIAAEHGINIGNVLDDIVKHLQIAPTEKPQNDVFRFSLIGKPNVGKSSLANALLNDQRLIVSPIAGTTRDAVDCYFQYHNQEYCLIDTAGIRRSGQANKLEVERYAVLRAKKSLMRSKCVFLVLDIATGITEQDEIIGGLAYKANIPTIILANKWDIYPNKDDNSMQMAIKLIRDRFVYLNWAPIVFISALTKNRIHKIFEMIEEIKAQLNIKVATSVLEDLLLKAQALNPIPNVHGKKIKLSYAVQVKGQIPTFVIFCNDPNLLHFSYARFIENQIRSALGLTLVPITVYYKSKNARVRNK
ncbi:ribosome biogenesis GTPase Der [Mycoplasmoides fastidiosum]|uniref:ribosome biogenesis GTPase Der n=1 Tax=Mycoplasmoides fastidiosum TaxID=92758 RepID=UPI002FE6EB8C